MYYKLSSARKNLIIHSNYSFQESIKLNKYAYTAVLYQYQSKKNIVFQAFLFSLFIFSLVEKIERIFSANEFMPEFLRAKLLLLPISVQILATIIPRNVRNFHLLWQLLTKRSEHEPITQSYRVSTRSCVTFNKIIFQAWQFI